MKLLAKYGWTHAASKRGGVVSLYDNDMVTGTDTSPPTTVAAAVRFMYVTSSKELTVDGYTVDWILSMPTRKGKK